MKSRAIACLTVLLGVAPIQYASAITVSNCEGDIVEYGPPLWIISEGVIKARGKSKVSQFKGDSGPTKEVPSCQSGRPLCKDISGCTEAVYLLVRCGHKHLDRDGDGWPCEDICGER